MKLTDSIKNKMNFKLIRKNRCSTRIRESERMNQMINQLYSVIQMIAIKKNKIMTNRL